MPALFDKQRFEIPVVVHRWFADGEGWAYHPNLKNTWSDMAGDVDKYLKSRSLSEEFVVPHRNGDLIGEKIADEDCLDPKAVNRRPFILRMAFVGGDARQYAK